MFTKTLRMKSPKKMTANDNNCYLSYLNKFVGEFNNTYNRFIGKKPICAD